ncbi:MAG TPA: hypothetical protein EYH43_06495 [Persephonella sp.]|nr:hypothetical protein [Hydrogenothermaceae bacterium]HIQ25610.1 hypothetical protein [Persephonella sp.]
MFSFITKLWLFLLLIAILAIALSISIIVLIWVGVVLLFTIPYVFYLKWKAKKQLEENSIYEAKIIKVENLDD